MHVRPFAHLGRLTRLGAALACAALTPLAGCGDSPTSGGSARLSILLTDAPGDFAEAVVTISEVYLQGEGGRLTLRSEPITTDLLTLANSTASLVSEAAVPPGRYSELRFVVTGGYVKVERAGGGFDVFATPNYAGVPAGVPVAGTLHMPSFAQSGLKVKLPGDGLTLESEQKIVLVDFDVARSFGREAGNSGRWVMSPVLTATEIQASGGIAVTAQLAAGVVIPTIQGVAPGVAGLKARLSNAEGAAEDVALTDANGDGVFEASFAYVLPGAWSVSLVAPPTVQLTTTPVQPAAVTLASGGSASVAFTITAATVVPPAP
jgi:hypothetical protein